jgi:hypothetical protein
MQISAAQIDDLKTERKDIMAPLPRVMRLVPILFYGSLAFLVVIGSVSSLRAKFAGDRRNAVLKQVEDWKTQIAEVKKERSALEVQISEAVDLEDWVLASMPLQPLVVAIIRSMNPQSSVVDLTIERDAETPSQLRIGLRLNSESDKQLEQTLEVIRSMNYREFNPTQTRIRGDLDYKASLLWQDPNSEKQTPEERSAGKGGA